MKIKTYSLLSSRIFIRQSPLAKTLQGTPQLNLNLYALGANINGSISLGNLSYTLGQPFQETIKELDHPFMAYIDRSKVDVKFFIDQQIIETTKKNISPLQTTLKTQLNQSSYRVSEQTYTPSGSTTPNNPKFVIEPMIGIYPAQTKALLVH